MLGTVQAAVCCVSDGVGQSGMRMRIEGLAVLRPSDGSPRIGALTVVGQYTREAPASEALRIPLVHEAIDVPSRPSMSHRRSAVIQMDQGTDLASCVLDARAHQGDAWAQFGRFGKPTDMAAYTASFHARPRAECPDAHVLEPLEAAMET